MRIRNLAAIALLPTIAWGQLPLTCTDLSADTRVEHCSPFRNELLVVANPGPTALVWVPRGACSIGPSPNDSLSDCPRGSWQQWGNVPDTAVVSACYGDVDGGDCQKGPVDGYAFKGALRGSPGGADDDGDDDDDESGSRPPGLFSLTVQWTPPVSNEDGSRLLDLAGYTVYWGEQSGGPYASSKLINEPTATFHVIDGFAAGLYYFVMTSRDLEGNESAFSNEAVKDVRDTGTVDLTPPNPPWITTQGTITEVCTATGNPGERVCQRL